MGWMLRVVRHRARAQLTILSTVAAVTLVGATLLGTFALLLAASEHRALEVALDRAPAATTDVAVRLDLGPGQDAQAAVDAGSAFLDSLLGDVPDTRAQWLTSQWLAVQGSDDPVEPLVYLGVTPAPVTLVDGAWADAPTTDGGRIPVAVPQALADAYGWTVGEDVDTIGTGPRVTTNLTVVGVYVADPPRSLWARDALAGRVHEPSYPYPGTFGFITTSAWGPLLVDPAVLLGGAVASQTVRVVSQPDLTAATPGDLRALRRGLDTAQEDVTAASVGTAVSASVSTDLDATIDAADADLAITRVSVIIVGLMLLVVAVTVLLLAARLLAERRAPEQTLMSSRGASGAQLLGFAALEALAVALLTAALAPWLARWLYGLVTSLSTLEAAGLHVDPGHPPALWLACGLGSALLAAVLLGPLLRRRGSAVDAEQQLVRQDRRQALARSGADIAVVALAAVALWQLTTHDSPVVAGSARLDPLLVCAPALVLLAGGVLAGRILPLVASAGERLAARSRALVAPLAAWEVSRRPGRAAGATLLLTLAIAVGTFAQGYLDTWRTSQRDQAEVAVGADLRAVGADGTPIHQSATVAADPDLTIVSPVGTPSVGLGIATGQRNPVRSVTTSLLAVDTRHAGDLLRGRTPDDDPAGWTAVTAGLAPESLVTGVPVPAGATELRMRVTAFLDLPARTSATLSLVVQDARGLRTGLPLPSRTADGSTQDATLGIPEGVGPLTIIGLTTRVGSSMVADDAETQAAFEVDVTDLQAVVPGTDGDEIVTELDMTRAQWRTQATSPDWDDRLPSTAVDDDGIRLKGPLPTVRLIEQVLDFATTTFSPEPIVHAVVTPQVLEVLGAEADDVIEIDVEGATVQLRVDRVVDYLPSLPRTAGILVDRDALTRATWTRGSSATLSDEWWARVDDDRADAAAARLTKAGMGDLVTRVDAVAQGTDGPLRVGVQAALWLVTFAAAGLAVAGLAMSATVAVRTRRLELARLQALGASRGGLVRAVVAEHALLGAVGIAAGLAVGALLVRVIGPLVTVSGTGQQPVPHVVVQWPWDALLVLVGGTAVLAGLVVLLTTQALLRRTSGALLRLGDEG